jgi:hypothetical protein
MKFVAAKARAGGSQRGLAKQASRAIAEMETPFGKARDEWEQPGHLAPTPLAVHQGATEDHIAVALAVDRLSMRGGTAEPAQKGLRGTEAVRPKFRICGGSVASGEKNSSSAP